MRIFCGLCCLALLGACGGGSGGGEPSSRPGNPFSIAGTPVTLIWEGQAYAFEPQAGGRAAGTLEFQIVNAPPWANFDSATGRLYGVPGQADVGTYTDIRISATDGASRASLPSFDLRVDPVSHGAVMLTWTPPSQNTDNSPLNDLAGFRIYGGTDPTALAALASVEGAGVSSHLLDGLSPGKYYLASTAINAFGIESTLSNFTVILVR